uniref:Amino acid transporter transmembrane domain-containing protein n=2 Tax=Quercus lobata TaxID=97700 RepID=A0A7N2LYG5_QUELO
MYLEIFMALVSYTISLLENLITVLSGMQIKVPWAKLSSSQLLTIMAVFLIALPRVWKRNVSSISFLSSAGILISLLIFISVPCTSIFGGVKLKPSHKMPVLQLHNIPAIYGLYIFSYIGHIGFLELYKEMKDPSKFTKVSIVSFTIVTALYTVLAFFGAKLFGPEVSPQITHSMPPHLLVTKIALWATVLTSMTKYALETTSFAIQLEHNLLASMSSKLKMIIRGCVGSFLLLLILALALSVPYFEDVLSLTGSLVSIAICIIFPCAFHTKICWGQIPKPLIILNLTLIAFGSLLGVFGAVSSSKLLVQSLRSRAHHSA